MVRVRPEAHAVFETWQLSILYEGKQVGERQSKAATMVFEHHSRCGLSATDCRLCGDARGRCLGPVGVVLKPKDLPRILRSRIWSQTKEGVVWRRHGLE